jgi:hypothetical protein
MIVATLANGLYSFLARTGGVESAAFSAHVEAYCGIPQPVTLPTFTCACIPTDLPEGLKLPTLDFYSTAGYRIAFKLVKVVVFLLLVLGALLSRARSLEVTRPRWPMVAVAIAAGIGLAISASNSGAAFALMSTRPLEFLAIAFIGARYAAGLPTLGRWMLCLIALELLFVLFELAFALPTRGCPHAFRASGTLVVPSSLGFFAAGALAFVVAFVPKIDWRLSACAWLMVLALVLASGSGTGLAMLLLTAAWILLARLPGKRHQVGIATVLALLGLAWSLPVLTQRTDIYDSVFGDGGRWGKLVAVLSENDTRANLIGRGLGVGSNQTALLAEHGSRLPDAIDAGQPFYADSTVTWLFVQLGLVGTIAFYSMLAWAFKVDPQARIFYLAVAVGSLTISLPEAFPLNFLLGLALARSATRAPTLTGEAEA